MDLLFFLTVLHPWCLAVCETLAVNIRSIEQIKSEPNSVKQSFAQQGCSDHIVVRGSGVLESPEYPKQYLNPVSCSWHIIGNPGEAIAIRFEDFDIEESGECDHSPCCEYNWIKIGPSLNHTDVQYCGKRGFLPPVFISYDVMVTVKYHISSIISGGHGFRLNYWTDPRKAADCNGDQFRCADGSCVTNKIRCNNNQNDCEDGSDEANCPGSSICSPGLLCSSVVYCYDGSKYCDGVIDCPDFSDETNCGYCSVNYTRCGPESTQCYNPATQRCNKVLDCVNGEDEKDCKHFCPGKIMCSSGTGCYSLSDRCNGIAQCGDSSDEKDCGPELCNFEHGGFLCDNGLCIREVWKCDHTYDCGDGSDEVNCLRNSVLTAAIMGSLVCVLLLIVAISCTCRLYALRSVDNNHLTSHETPLSRLSQEFFFREPPPSYAVAVGEHPRSLCVENLHYGTGPRRSRRRPRRPRRRHEVPHSSPVSALDTLLNQNCIIIGPNPTVPLSPSHTVPVHSPENLSTQSLNQSSPNAIMGLLSISDSISTEQPLIQSMPSVMSDAQNEIRHFSSCIDMTDHADDIIAELMKDASVPHSQSSGEGSSADSDIQCTFRNTDGGANVVSLSSGSTSEFNCDTDDMQPLIT